MSLMKNLKTTENAVQERDTLGGYQLFDTDVYEAKLKMAYVQESKNGALGAVLHFSIGERDYSETIYFTNRKKETFYTNKQTQETHFLPGYNLLNSLSMLTIGVEWADMETEERVVKIYDYDAKADVNTNVDAFTELFDQMIKLAIEKQLQDKTEKSGDDYVPTGETIERNAIVKCFHADKDVTLTEAVAKSSSEFMGKWLTKNQGKVIDKTNKDQPANKNRPAKTAGGSPTSGEAKKSKRNLFDDE